METIFSQANISPTQGTELLLALGLDAWEIQNPAVFNKYLDVAKYLERFEDGALIARTVGRSALKGERLDKVLEYVQLRERLDAVRARRAELPDSGMIKDESDEIRTLRHAIDSEERSLLSEITIYEQ